MQVGLTDKEAFNILGWDYTSKDELFGQYDKDKITVNAYEDYNSIIFNHKCQLSGGHSDDSALTVSEDYGWGWIADKGVDFIQTDWPMMLIDYLKRSEKYYRSKKNYKYYSQCLT